MKKNKSPGMDGITIEFYQAFWPLLGNLLVDVFNESYELGKLPDSQRKSVMSLIFKRGDEDDISNYRSISLTNTDYRILAFTLAERMQKILGDIISNDQTAYVKGRYMGTNIRLVSDVIDYYDLLNKSGLLLMVDFQKAFDSLDWHFLFKTLNFSILVNRLLNGLMLYTINLKLVSRTMGTCQTFSISQEAFVRDALSRLFCFYYV